MVGELPRQSVAFRGGDCRVEACQRTESVELIGYLRQGATPGFHFAEK